MRPIKKYVYLAFLCSIFWSQHTVAQDWAWAKYIPWSLNIPSDDLPVFHINMQPRGVTHDAAGNAYITGFIEVVDKLGATKQTSIFFVAKYNASGNLVWMKKYGEPYAPQASGNDIIADAAGNFYVTGTFSGTLTLSRAVSLTSSGSDDIFIIKYNTLGNVVWAKKVGGSHWDGGNSIALGPQGNILITGTVNGTVIFGPNTISADPTPNSSDYFIAKYEGSTGDVMWVKRGSSSGSSNAWGDKISVDPQGQIWTSGPFVEMTIDNVTISNMVGAYFVARHDATGNLIWIKNYPVSEVEVAGDHQGNAYITGHFSNNIALGGFTLTTPYNDTDAFVAKMDDNGNILWAKSVSSTAYDAGFSLAVDASNNCYVTGYSDKNIFVNKYTPNGGLVWNYYTLTDGAAVGLDISTDDDGNSYVSGTLIGDVLYFGNNITVSGNYQSSLTQNITQGVVAKLSATDIFFPPEIDPGVWEEWPLPPDPDPTSRLKAYPNPSDDIFTLHFVNPVEEVGYLGIYNQKGKLVYQQSFKSDLEQRISLREFGRGYFYARVIVGKDAFYQTLIVR